MTTNHNNVQSTPKLHAISIPLLKGEENWPEWRKSIEDVLAAKNYDHCVNPLFIWDHVPNNTNHRNIPDINPGIAVLPQHANVDHHVLYHRRHYPMLPIYSQDKVFPGSITHNRAAILEIKRHCDPILAANIPATTICAHNVLTYLSTSVGNQTPSNVNDTFPSFNSITFNEGETLEIFLNRFSLFKGRIDAILASNPNTTLDRNATSMERVKFLLSTSLPITPFAAHKESIRSHPTNCLITLLTYVRTIARDFGFTSMPIAERKVPEPVNSLPEESSLFARFVDSAGGRGRGSNLRQHRYAPYQDFSHRGNRGRGRFGQAGRGTSSFRGRGNFHNKVQDKGNQDKGSNSHHSSNGSGSTASLPPSQIRCYRCKGFGHYARNCISPADMDLSMLSAESFVDVEMTEADKEEQQKATENHSYYANQEGYFENEYENEDYYDQGF